MARYALGIHVQGPTFEIAEGFDSRIFVIERHAKKNTIVIDPDESRALRPALARLIRAGVLEPI